MSQKYSGKLIDTDTMSKVLDHIHLRSIGLGRVGDAYPMTEQINNISRDVSALSMNISHMIECLGSDTYSDHEHTPEQVGGSFCLMAMYCMVILYNITDGRIGHAVFDANALLT